MSLTLIEINGELYHAQDLYDEDGENVVDTIEILDEEGELIPASVCLCHAFEPGECCCATTAWEGYGYDEDQYDDYEWEDEDDTAQTDAD